MRYRAFSFPLSDLGMFMSSDISSMMLKKGIDLDSRYASGVRAWGTVSDSNSPGLLPRQNFQHTIQMCMFCSRECLVGSVLKGSSGIKSSCAFGRIPALSLSLKRFQFFICFKETFKAFSTVL